MNHLRLCVCLLLLTSSSMALAQQDGTATTAAIQVDANGAKQFDFLLGQWEIEVHPKVNSLIALIHGTPKLAGTWVVHRTGDGGGIDDELRIVDGSGNPITSERAQRVYDAVKGRWKITGNDSAHARVSEATAQWLAGEMRIEGHYTDATGKQILTRSRYYDITTDSFHLQQDRSVDDGQNWDEGVVRIDARRVAIASP